MVLPVIVAVLVGLFFWLDGPAEWRRIKEETRQRELREREEQAQAEADAAAQKLADEEWARKRQARIDKLAARRKTVTVWQMPEPSLFDVPEESELDRDFDAPDPDDELRKELTGEEARELFDAFKSDPRMNWMVGLNDCEARADLMAEIAAERGIRLVKLWALASDLDRGSIVSGFDGSFGAYLNRSRTEAMKWNFHVAPMGRLSGAGFDLVVFDPLLFEGAVDLQVWKDWLTDGDSEPKFETTERWAYSDAFDTVMPNARHYRVKRRNSALAMSFELEDQDTWDGLQATLRGRYVDRLQDEQPEDFKRFCEYLEQPAFRYWWTSTTGYDRLEAILAADHYFNIPIDRIHAVTDSVSPELGEQAIREAFWRELFSFFERLIDDYRAWRNREYTTDIEFSDWIQPDAQGRWST